MQGQMHQDQADEQQGQDEMDIAPVVTAQAEQVLDLDRTPTAAEAAALRGSVPAAGAGRKDPSQDRPGCAQKKQIDKADQIDHEVQRRASHGKVLKHGCSDGRIPKHTPIFPPGATAVKGNAQTDSPGLTNHRIPSRLVCKGPV